MFEKAAFTGLIAGAVSLAAFFPYIIATVKQKANPNRVTWFIWVIVATIEAISYYAVGARDTMWIAGGFINLFAVESWTFVIYAFPIYIFLVNTTIAALVMLRPKSGHVPSAHN